jgi:cell division septum initiation protein DivIVA
MIPRTSDIVKLVDRIVERRVEEVKQENAELRERLRKLEELVFAFTMAHQASKKND